jgi:hypothetical protein
VSVAVVVVIVGVVGRLRGLEVNPITNATTLFSVGGVELQLVMLATVSTWHRCSTIVTVARDNAWDNVIGIVHVFKFSYYFIRFCIKFFLLLNFSLYIM